MKGMVMAGMMGLSLILGIMAVLGGAWLQAGGEDAELMEEMGQTQTTGLNTMNVEWDLTKVNPEATSSDCDDMAELMSDDDDDGTEVECDGTTLLMSASQARSIGAVGAVGVTARGGGELLLSSMRQKNPMLDRLLLPFIRSVHSM